MMSNSVNTKERKAFYLRALIFIHSNKIYLYKYIQCPASFLLPDNSYSASPKNKDLKTGSYQLYFSSISGGLILSILQIDVDNPASYLSANISYLAYPVHQYSNFSSLTYPFFSSNFILSILQIDVKKSVSSYFCSFRNSFHKYPVFSLFLILPIIFILVNLFSFFQFLQSQTVYLFSLSRFFLFLSCSILFILVKKSVSYQIFSKRILTDLRAFSTLREELCNIFNGAIL